MDQQLCDKITAQIQGLGTTSADIATSLQLEGIKAIPGSGFKCALSQYVVNHFPEVKISTGLVSAFISTPSNPIGPADAGNGFTVRHSGAMAAFVLDFDSMVYPDLIDRDVFMISHPECFSPHTS